MWVLIAMFTSVALCGSYFTVVEKFDSRAACEQARTPARSGINYDDFPPDAADFAVECVPASHVEPGENI
jgi:hypothetical protein